MIFPVKRGLLRAGIWVGEDRCDEQQRAFTLLDVSEANAKFSILLSCRLWSCTVESGVGSDRWACLLLSPLTALLAVSPLGV